MLTRRDLLATSALLPFTTQLHAADSPNLTDFYKTGETRLDSRLGAYKTLDDYFPFSVPKTLDAWKARAHELRNQLKVALGIYPEPPKTDLQASVHGKIDRPGYTIEKVYFQSIPGHSVCGNLYRPAKVTGQAPAVLFAHGHWAGGRLHVESEAAAKKMVERGEEADLTQARFFMQALPITLAKLGFVVFQFDMIGYADSTAIPHIAKSGVPHPQGFADAEGELRLQSLLGLQAWNCIRSVDFVSSLPDVDPKRIGMTGASGGGTQTFITAALDERIACAVPAVMVSTGMQGGCICENCSLLRLNTGNVEIAALIAPRPLALTGANDWTKEIMTKGFPELQKLYGLFGKPDLVAAKCWPEYPHNYNRPARESMYRWMLKHLMGKDEPDFREPSFEPLPVKDLSVFDSTHPRPKTELDAVGVRKKLTELTPKSFDADTMRTAVKAMICSDFPKEIAVRKGPIEVKSEDLTIHKALLGRVGGSDALPTIGMFSSKFTGANVCVWVSDTGKSSLFQNGKLSSEARALIDAGYAIVANDLLGTGEAKSVKLKGINPVYAGFTYGYNRSPIAEEAHDILTGLAFAKTMLKAKRIVLVDWSASNLPTILAAGLAGPAVDKVAVAKRPSRLAGLKDASSPLMLPGGLKYGDVDGFLKLLDAKKTMVPLADDASKPEDVVKWLTAV